MRQAGRSLPEYRAARGDGSILAAIADAALSAELTLQPVRRYGVDAAILFSDIVVPLHAIGFGVDIEPGRGPVVAEPFRSAGDLRRLRPFEPEADAPYVAEAVGLVRHGAGRDAASPSIGFAGAPFTVASYLVEGGPSRTFAKVKALMHGDPALWDQLWPSAWPPWPWPSLRAQIAGRRAGRAALRQLGRLARPRRVRALRPARHPRRLRRHRRSRRADHPLRRGHRRAPRPDGHRPGPTSSGSTGGCRSTRPVAGRRTHAVQGNLDPALCLAPWPVVEAADPGTS